ncbi:hypothetical protein D3879_06420 [Pseudomonas cavernicola]|uniref:Uncharacterized protein n=1 Tax=Pseudomonas cavernicola TaxID=2320866 RepID=A0A418XKG1_9PSED|nr:hypothetical protein [Pseudomonas cavernicola]RJG12911.1 hypothetical protein D3879_06420 [Pseudomonas cavernicola]
MNITKFGPPEFHGIDLDCDVYFTLNKPEVDTLSNPVTQAAIVAELAPGAPPFGAIAAALILNYINLMKERAGPNGVSVKSTIRQGAGALMQMKEFIAEPI